MDELFTILTELWAIVVPMIKLPKLMTHKIVTWISFHGLVIVLILAISAITFFSTYAEEKKDVSCPDDPSGAQTEYVLPVSKNVWLRANPGESSSQIRKARKQELLHVIGRECVPERGKKPTEWYQVELLGEGHAYIAGLYTKPLNKREKEDVEAWSAFQTKLNIEALNFYLGNFRKGFFIETAKKRLPDMQDEDINSKVVSLRNELDELSYIITNYIDLFSDKNLSFSGPPKLLTEALAKRRDDFDAKVSKAQERLEGLEKDLGRLEAPGKAQKYSQQLKNSKRIKSNLAQIKKLNNDPTSGLNALSILMENDISTFLNSGDSTGSEKSNQSKDGEATPSKEKSEAPVTTDGKRENTLPETDKPGTFGSSSTPIVTEKPAEASKLEGDKKNSPELKPTQVKQQPANEPRSLLERIGGIILAVLLTLITVGFVIAFVLLFLRNRDLHEEVAMRNAMIKHLRLQLAGSKFTPGSDGLAASATSLSVDEYGAASRKLDQASGEVHFPNKPEPVPEPEQVDEGPTIEEFVADYKGIIYDVGKVDEFQAQWDVVGASRKPGTDREELGTLVFEPSQPLNQVDFWCAPITDANTFLILPSRKQATSAATLVSDDGRPGQKLFRGIFEIIGGTMFELLDPARATREGDTLTVTKKGEVNLPTNSR